MTIQESGEMYLETILVLSRSQETVRSVDVATRLGFSKPSVCRAVGLLKEGEFIDVDAHGHITLTDAGLEVAARIYERHTVLSAALERLGVPKEQATADACKMEHDISDVSFDAIKKAFFQKS